MGNKKYWQDGENIPYSLKITRPALSTAFLNFPCLSKQ